MRSWRLGARTFPISFLFLLSGWQWRPAREKLEHFDQFGITRRVFNGLGQFLRRHGTGVIADDLSVFTMKLGIFESLARRFLKDLHTIFGRSRRQNVRRARKP